MVFGHDGIKTSLQCLDQYHHSWERGEGFVRSAAAAVVSRRDQQKGINWLKYVGGLSYTGQDGKCYVE